MNTYIFVENEPRIWHLGRKTEKEVRGNIIVSAENEEEAFKFVRDVYDTGVRLIEVVEPNNSFTVGEYSKFI